MNKPQSSQIRDKYGIKAILLLPVNAVIVIPALILLFSKAKIQVAFNLLSSLGVFCFIGGLFLAAQTIRLFRVKGQGTLAPWNPPLKQVWEGPYLYVRNPMISGIGFMLLGEVIFFLNDGLAVWMMIFFIANALYIPYWEEPGLLKRFGSAYDIYRVNVPRWIPRLTAWNPKELASIKGDATRNNTNHNPEH